MASFFQLELDTTPPVLEIFSPNNASAREHTRIRVQADEMLSTYQNIYAVDDAGNRQDIVFNYGGTYFETDVTFNFDNKLVTIVAQLKDTVDNLSDVVTKAIRIINGKPLTLSIDEQDREINLQALHRKAETGEAVQKAVEKTRVTTVHTGEAVRRLDVGPARNP